MGASNDIHEINIQTIKDYECSQCSQKFTEQDYSDGNFDLWFDTSSDVIFKKLELGEWWELGVAVRDLTHKLLVSDHLTYYDCPDTETCEICYERFLTEEMEQSENSYYCTTCYYQKIENHE